MASKSSLRSKESHRHDQLTLEPILIVSPGKDEEDTKDQDRASVIRTHESSGQQTMILIVCDGTTTSPKSAEAAEYVAENAKRIYEQDGMTSIVAGLYEKRNQLLNSPVKISNEQPISIRTMFEEIVRDKYRVSYQTTFVSACLRWDENARPGKLTIKAAGCGDSGMFIFDADGHLLFDNLGIRKTKGTFNHASPVTKVLPDNHDPETADILFDSQEYDENVRLLLCSDGFYDAFRTFDEIYRWLERFESELRDEASQGKLMSELHQRLSGRTGDDDISLILVQPTSYSKKTTWGFL